MGLKPTLELEIIKIEICEDSQFIINQVKGFYDIKDKKIEALQGGCDWVTGYIG